MNPDRTSIGKRLRLILLVISLLLVVLPVQAWNFEYSEPGNVFQPEQAGVHFNTGIQFKAYDLQRRSGDVTRRKLGEISRDIHQQKIPAVSNSALVNFEEQGGVERRDTVPKPSSVLRKSMILPGWGQVVNGQTWKVPIIYGLLAGLTYYSIFMDQSYRDYRAAYYNSQQENGDERFGPTPGYIDPNQNPESMRHARNLFRNRRDLTFIGIGLAYGLNLVDAYVFAHMRDFDVSDDLSARISIGPPNTLQVQKNVPDSFSGVEFSDITGSRGVALTVRFNWR